MKPRQGLRERHIEIRYNCKILLGAGYLKQQKTSERDGEQQQDYGEPVNLCCYGLPERHMSSESHKRMLRGKLKYQSW